MLLPKSSMGIKKFLNSSTLILLLILVLALGLRLYHLREVVVFDADQEYAAQFAFDVLRIFPLRLIGQGLSVQGLFLGPWYFYFLVPFYALTALHPIGGYLGSIAWGLLTIIVYYFLGKRTFGAKTGLLLALFRATLFSFISWDHAVAPAFSADLLVLGTWYCLFHLWQRQSLFLLPLSFLFGFYTSIHPILAPFYLIFLLILVSRSLLPSPKILIVSIVLFVLPAAPLITFEYFRKFVDLKTLSGLASHGNGEAKTLSTLWAYAKFIFLSPANIFNLQNVGLTSGLATAFWLAVWKKVPSGFHQFLVLVTALVFLVYYWLLPLHAPDYYFMGATIVIFIYSVSLLARLTAWQKIIGFGLASGVIAWNLYLFGQLVEAPLKISLAAKEDVVKKIATLSPDNRMELGYDVDYGQHFGLGYLQRYYRIDNHGGGKVPKYTIVIPLSRRPNEITYSSGNVGLIIQ